MSIFNKSTNLISVHGVPHKIALCFLTQADSMLIFSLGGPREKERLRDKGVLRPFDVRQRLDLEWNRTSFLLIGKGKKNLS